MQGLRPGAYALRVTYLGYAPRLQDVTITIAMPVSDVGRFALSRKASVLEGVAIPEDQAQEQQAGTPLP